MLVYMLLNVIEERAYVGQTTKTLKERLATHAESVKLGSRAPVHEAMRRWPQPEYWLNVVLQNCYDQEELDRCEEAWIERCCSADTGVGYNTHRTVATKKQRAPISEEQRDFFRQCGQKGAEHGKKGARRREDMSEEEREKYREWGRKGALASKKLKAEQA